jgi:hypothetical protein
MAKTLVFDDGGVADALVLAEDTVGKRVAFPSHLQPGIREVVKFNVLTAKAFGDIVSFQDDLLAVKGQGQLLADVTLFAVTQDVVQPSSNGVERAVRTLSRE